jgi:alpha-galactosidase
MKRLLIPCLLALAFSPARLHAAPVENGSDREPGRLTPPESPAPRLNGAKVFGVRPNSPVFFQLAVSGERPMSFKAEGLPVGATLDASTGRISGKLSVKGEYAVTVAATNAKGSATGTIRIVVGDRIALTPPMGWNSWYCFSESISEEQMKAMATAMHATGMVNYGWTYINMDDCWQGEKRDASGAMTANAKFRDLAGMTRFIHDLGLKAGLYSTPWMGSYAGFMGGSAPDDSRDYSGIALPASKRLQPAQIYGRYPNFESRGADKTGANWLFDRDAKRFAEWGFDYLKVDWKPINIPTTARISKDLASSGRDIVLSLSNAASREWAKDYGAHAQLWRTSGDVHDSWGSVSSIGFDQNPRWAEFSKPGNWNDPDMLQVGFIGVPNRANEGHLTHLTPNEQYAQVSLWAIQAAPLIISCDLRKLDDFTAGLLMNPEVIAVDQDSLGVAGKKHDVAKNLTAFVKPLEDGAVAVAIFNRADKAAGVSVSLSQLGLSGKFAVRDLWRMAEEGEVLEKVAVRVGRHGVKLVKLTPVK